MAVRLDALEVRPELQLDHLELGKLGENAVVARAARDRFAIVGTDEDAVHAEVFQTALHAHGVIPGVDVQRRAGHVARVVRQEVGSRGPAVASICRWSGARSSNIVSIVVKPAMERAASVRTGPAEIALTRMFLKPRSHAR